MDSTMDYVPLPNFIAQVCKAKGKDLKGDGCVILRSGLLTISSRKRI